MPAWERRGDGGETGSQTEQPRMTGVEIPDRGFGAEAVRAAGVAGWAVLPALRLRRRVAFPREGPKVAGRPLRVQPLRGPVHRHYQEFRRKGTIAVASGRPAPRVSTLEADNTPGKGSADSG